MPVYIEKVEIWSGRTNGRQTRKDRATQPMHGPCKAEMSNLVEFTGVQFYCKNVHSCFLSWYSNNQIVIKNVVWSIHPFNQQYFHPSIQPTLLPSIQPAVLLSILRLHQQYYSPVKGPSGRLCLPRCPYLGNTLGFVLFWIHLDLYNTRLVNANFVTEDVNVKRDQY